MKIKPIHYPNEVIFTKYYKHDFFFMSSIICPRCLSKLDRARLLQCISAFLHVSKIAIMTCNYIYFTAFFLYNIATQRTRLVPPNHHQMYDYDEISYCIHCNFQDEIFFLNHYHYNFYRPRGYAVHRSVIGIATRIMYHDTSNNNRNNNNNIFASE